MKGKKAVGARVGAKLFILLTVLVTAFSVTYAVSASAYAAEDAAAIYLDGEAGDDDNAGTVDNPVATYEKAVELAKQAGTSTVYVTGTVTVSGEETWNDGVTLLRDEGFTSGTMVVVERGAMLTLENVTLDGNSVAVAAGSSSASGEGNNIIRVEGTLNITDGATIQNHAAVSTASFSSAVLVYCGTVNMSGGSVANNAGGKWGGAFSFAGESSDTTAVMNLTGGRISDNTSSHNGGGIYLYTYSEMNMDGGTISGNSAPNNGGGVYVGREAVATITSGYLTSNAQTSNMNYGGGAVYVESDQGVTSANPGKLYLYNAEITGNSCTGANGSSAADLGYDSTIAACNTAVLQVSITDGAVIHDNDARYDIMAYFDTDTATMEISPFMLGGGLYNWYDRYGNTYDVGGLAWSLATVDSNAWGYATTDVSTSDDTVTGLNRIKTVISGNSAVVMGAAIGTNGEVYIGKSDGNATLEISKVWDSSVTNIPESVDVEVYATDGSGNTTSIGTVTLSEDNGWKVTVDNLPKYDSDGLEYTYSVVESTNNYYADVASEKRDVSDDEAAYTFTITNYGAGNLSISKDATGDLADPNDEFTFEVTLSGDRISGTQQFGDYAFEDGVTTVTLKAGETVTIEDIPAGTAYAVEEVDACGYTLTSCEGTEGVIECASTAMASFVNDLSSDEESTPTTPDDDEITGEPEATEPEATESETTEEIETKTTVDVTVETKTDNDGDLPSTGDVAGALAGAVALAGAAIAGVGALLRKRR